MLEIEVGTQCNISSPDRQHQASRTITCVSTPPAELQHTSDLWCLCTAFFKQSRAFTPSLFHPFFVESITERRYSHHAHGSSHLSNYCHVNPITSQRAHSSSLSHPPLFVLFFPLCGFYLCCFFLVFRT